MNYIFGIDKEHLKDVFDYYKDYDSSTENPNALVVFRSPEVVVTVYKTLRVMIQGTSAYEEYLMWSDLLEFEPVTEKNPAISTPSLSLEHSPYYFSSSLGSDEVGTGDFFGPVVVCTAFVDKKMIPKLESMGIKDSKKMSDDAILSVGEALIDLLPHTVLVVDNQKYNALIQEGYNLNKIKAYLHNHAIKKCLLRVKNDFDYVILDQFCPENLYFSYLSEVDAFRKITFLTKAESVHLSVAAASVIARYTFLKEMDTLSKKIGITLPLGASMAVDMIGKRIVLQFGLDFLPEIAKMNFKNVGKIKEMLPKR